MDAPDVMPAWSLVRGYFSGATLFLLLNVVIGTIALTSRSRSHRRRHSHHGDEDNHHQQDPKDYIDQYAPAPAPAPLARTSSVMERLRSLGLYRFRSGDFPPEYNYSLSAADDETSSKQQQAQYARSQSEPATRPPVNKPGNMAEKAAKARVAKKPIPEVKKLERAPVPAPARLVQRAPRAPVARAAVTEAASGTCVDERADDFINKFRQQLQLQRLNSLLNYKEMLNRGT
uniref:Uncharacterized protein n=1 Tax=Avena sativa TaxID=4498 RepID=A0ACD5VSF1_AVESA